MTQETLEEAAVINYKKLYEGEPLTQDVPIDAFIDGAKWQQEQDKNKWSYKEVEELLISCKDRFGGSELQDYTHDDRVKEWFKQFKKK